MAFESRVGEIRIQSLEGLGASYRMSGYFVLKGRGDTKVNFSGVAFGGHYGGHNVNIDISEACKQELLRLPGFKSNDDVDALLAEVQRRILNGDMEVDFQSIKNEEENKNVDPFGNISL